jgi:hypothetical protein
MKNLNVYTVAILAALFSTLFAPAHSDSGNPPDLSAAGNTSGYEKIQALPTDKLETMQGVAINSLQNINARNTLLGADLSKSIDSLREVVFISTERIKRITENANAEVRAEEAIKIFDDTIKLVGEYLDMVKDEGLLHKTTKKIRDSAFALQNENTKAAFGQDESTKLSYDNLAKTAKGYADRANTAWEAIVQERSQTQASYELLISHRQLLLATLKVKSIGEAVKELELVKTDLMRINTSIKNVVAAIQKEAAVK